jgi:hypothetical protein
MFHATSHGYETPYNKESSHKLPSDASPFALHPNNPGLRQFKKLVHFVGLFYLFEVPVRITFRVAQRLGPWYLPYSLNPKP